MQLTVSVFVFISDQHKTRIVYVCLFPISKPLSIVFTAYTSVRITVTERSKKSDFLNKKIHCKPRLSVLKCFSFLSRDGGVGSLQKGSLQKSCYHLSQVKIFGRTNVSNCSVLKEASDSKVFVTSAVHQLTACFLVIRSQPSAVFSAHCRMRIGTEPLPGHDALTTSHRTRRPQSPLTVITVNCRNKISNPLANS